MTSFYTTSLRHDCGHILQYWLCYSLDCVLGRFSQIDCAVLMLCYSMIFLMWILHSACSLQLWPCMPTAMSGCYVSQQTCTLGLGFTYSEGGAHEEMLHPQRSLLS